jgi:hypothetical protein
MGSFSVTALNAAGESGPSNTVSARGARPLIAVVNPFGTPLDDFSGLLGMQITVGSAPLKVVALGRVESVAGVQMAIDHDVKIAGPVVLQPQPDPNANDLATAADVANGSATVSPLSGVIAGAFRYETLETAVDLAADTTYFIVSKEVKQSVDPSADQWHTYDQSGATNPEGTLDRAVYREESDSSYSLPKNGVDKLYGPVNLLYHEA